MKLNILCICFNPIPYRGMTLFQRLAHLSGCHTLTLVTGKGLEILPEIEERVTVKRVGPSFGSRFLRYPLFLLAALVCAFRLRREHDFDQVYTSQGLPPTLVLGFVVAKLLGVRWVIDAMDDPMIEFFNYQKRWNWNPAVGLVIGFWRRVLRFVMPRSDLVVAIGKDSHDFLPSILVRRYGVRVDQLFSVPNGVDLAAIPESAPRAHPEKNTARLFYVGYVSPLRGLETLIRAVHYAKSHGVGVSLDLIGEAKDRDRAILWSLVDELSLTGAVVYHGSQPTEVVHEHISSADICIYPFPDVPELACVYPVKVFEYLAFSKPVVASRLPGVSAIIQDGENGLLVEPSDPAAMGQAIIRIVRDDRLRESIERNARPSIAPYDWRLINDKVNDRVIDVTRSATAADDG